MIPYTQDLLKELAEQHGGSIGAFSYGEPTVHMWGVDGRLVIGKYCSIAGAVTILLGGNHRPDWVTTYPFNVLRPEAAHIAGHPATGGDVVIGNDVWLGQGAIVLSGVTIGDGACVAGYSLVTKDVPPYSIVGGNPARVIRSRFPQDQVEALLELAWWDWPEHELSACFDLMLSSDVEAFIQAARARRPAPEATSCAEQPE